MIMYIRHSLRSTLEDHSNLVEFLVPSLVSQRAKAKAASNRSSVSMPLSSRHVPPRASRVCPLLLTLVSYLLYLPVSACLLAYLTYGCVCSGGGAGGRGRGGILQELLCV